MKRSAGAAAAGFTLIEITIAILVLASGLVILLGLQSSSIQRAVRDRDKLQAMLLARQILAAIEISREALPLQDKTAPAHDLLADLMPGLPRDLRLDDNLDKFMTRLRIQNWDLPQINQNSLNQDLVRRIDLTVYWSDSPLDAVNIVYFMPEEPGDEEDGLFD